MEPIYQLIENCKAQRAYRELKRNEYLKEFQKISLSHQPASPTQPPKVQEIHHHAEVSKAPLPVQKKQNVDDLATLEAENTLLKQKLNEIETAERERLINFKKEIGDVKEKYIKEIQTISERGMQVKSKITEKIDKIRTQTDAALAKNNEIEGINNQINLELKEGAQLMGKYATDIKKQYAEKILEFEQVFEGSNEKIVAMENDFNEDEFIENTLKNEELLKSIEQNANKSEEAGQILDDYEELLKGKKEILEEIKSSVSMKEKEIAKLAELEGKIKTIMEKMNEEKKLYINENSKMAAELLEIKELLMGAMNQQE